MNDSADKTPKKIKISGDKLLTSSGGETGGKKSRSRTPSLQLSNLSTGSSPQNSGDRDHSPHRRLRYWILDFDTAPIAFKISGEVIEKMQKYNAGVFITIDSDELTRLADDLLRINVVVDLIYVPGENSGGLIDKIDCFLTMMCKYSGIICVEADFVFVACSLVRPLFKYMIAREHKIKIIDEFVPIQNVLSNDLVYKLSVDLMAKQLLDLVCQYERLSQHDRIIVESYCKKCVEKFESD